MKVGSSFDFNSRVTCKTQFLLRIFGAHVVRSSTSSQVTIFSRSSRMSTLSDSCSEFSFIDDSSSLAGDVCRSTTDGFATLLEALGKSQSQVDNESRIQNYLSDVQRMSLNYDFNGQRSSNCRNTFPGDKYQTTLKNPKFHASPKTLMANEIKPSKTSNPVVKTRKSLAENALNFAPKGPIKILKRSEQNNKHHSDSSTQKQQFVNIFSAVNVKQEQKMFSSCSPKSTVRILKRETNTQTHSVPETDAKTSPNNLSLSIRESTKSDEQRLDHPTRNQHFFRRFGGKKHHDKCNGNINWRKSIYYSGCSQPMYEDNRGNLYFKRN